jgi:hypothetical protein
MPAGSDPKPCEVMPLMPEPPDPDPAETPPEPDWANVVPIVNRHAPTITNTPHVAVFMAFPPLEL